MGRAIGIVRVSEKGDRSGESFSSPRDQEDRIRAVCQRDHLDLIEVIPEIDVSGGKPLDKRAGLLRAVHEIEAGHADVLAAAYFDRLFRSLATQAEVLQRVEAAGGRVLAVDVGHVTSGTAGQWLSSTMLGAMSEYYRRSMKERSGEAQTRAVSRGMWMGRYLPLGYQRGDDGRLAPDHATSHVVEAAFQARAQGATIAAVRELLLDGGHALSYPAVARLLSSRAYLGEIKFGELVNNRAHDPIIDPNLWRAAQRVKVTPGRRANSARLLARLGVLRCGSCGARMSATSGKNGRVPIYRCGSHVGDNCPHPTTINAQLVETAVVEVVKAALGDVEGRASLVENARDAEVALERAQAELDALIDMLDPLEPAARRRLEAATAKRDEAQAQAEHLRSGSVIVSINAARDWNRLSIDARRALIRATVDRVLIAPGSGADRITIELFG